MSPDGDRLLLQLKALADPARMRLVALCRGGECSVTELTGVLGLSQPRVSQHLKQLCDAALLERFRDGQRVYYRVPTRVSRSAARLLELLPAGEADFAADAARLRALRSDSLEPRVVPVDRDLHRAIVDLTVTAPVGDLLDVGCGRGRLMKLLASRAHRAFGVDIDASARDIARAELLLAGLPNCSLRAGSMYRLPFADDEFDTVILDDVLADADAPVAALAEACRTLRSAGRLFILQSLGGRDVQALTGELASWCANAGLRLAPARLPGRLPEWLLAVARPARRSSEAA